MSIFILTNVFPGVTTVLSITTIGFGGGRAALPKVSYPTALDWFIIVCFVFVFGAIVEYAYINFVDTVTAEIKRILEERKKKKELEEEEKVWYSLLKLCYIFKTIFIN